MLDFVASLPVLNSLNRILGAVLGFLEVYLIIFIVLSILALTPAENVQAWIADSPLALFIIEHTPYLSAKLKTLWFSDVENFVLFGYYDCRLFVTCLSIKKMSLSCWNRLLYCWN